MRYRPDFSVSKNYFVLSKNYEECELQLTAPVTVELLRRPTSQLHNDKVRLYIGPLNFVFSVSKKDRNPVTYTMYMSAGYRRSRFYPLEHTYFPFTFVHVTVVLLLPGVHLSAPFPLWTQVVVVLPLGAAIAFKVAKGAIAIAAVGATITAAIVIVFVSIKYSIAIMFYKRIVRKFPFSLP